MVAKVLCITTVVGRLLHAGYQRLLLVNFHFNLRRYLVNFVGLGFSSISTKLYHL